MFSRNGHRDSAQLIPLRPFSLVSRHVLLAWGIQSGLAFLCLGAGLLAGWMGWESRLIEEEVSRYATATERTEALNQHVTAQLEQGRLTLSAEQLTDIQQEVRFVNLLAQKRRFSWTQLLHDLEETCPPGIAIGKIQRDAHAATMMISGHAASMGELQALMSQLHTRSAFRRPVLHHHQLADSSSPEGAAERDGGRVEFSVTVEYHGISDRGQTDAS
jgi:Tfp pilus assembly protein PilN